MTRYAFTDRKQGDMKKSEANRKKALRRIFGSERPILTVLQKHTGTVGIDAVVTVRRDAAVAVFAADCVPILFSDERKGIVAAAHAGWRGTLEGISGNTVSAMISRGSKPEDIRVWIGPHIGSCHYDVPEDRAHRFLSAFGGDPTVASFTDGHWRVNLGRANYRQLRDQGVWESHIQDVGMCTACNVDTYFSYRKDRKETFGEIMACIGFSDAP